MSVEESWQRFLALDRYGSGDAQGSFVYALHAQAAAREVALAVHEGACGTCRVWRSDCKERARLVALPAEKEGEE